MSSEALPSTRALLTRILNNLSTFSASAQNPDTTTTGTITELPNHPLLPPSTKPLLLTLHSLLPHCLLPALDLLDRGLVERWIPLSSTIPTNSSSWVYYITSKPLALTPSEPPNPFRSNTSSTLGTYIYEVRPSIWHCTCANFTLYAFASTTETDATQCNAVGEEFDDKRDWIWGSQYLSPSHSNAIPVCKHLLAAVLVEKCPTLFGVYVKEKHMSKEEMAEKACWWD